MVRRVTQLDPHLDNGVSLDHQPVLCGPYREASQVAYCHTVAGSCTPEVSVTATSSSRPPSNKRTSPTFFGLKYVMAAFGTDTLSAIS